MFLSKKLKVGIICGGCSLEHEVSLKSAFYIARVIDQSRFEITFLWIHKNGNWYIINNKDCSFSNFNEHECIPIFVRKISNQFGFCCSNFGDLLELDIIFPIVHGTLGEDGSLQGLLSIMNLPYVGSDVLGSSICMNKDITKCLLRDSGLPVLPFITFLKYERQKISFSDLIKTFNGPLFIKPVDQGSSIGVSWVNNHNEFNQALDIAFSCSNKIIIEPFIEGRELGCAVLGGNGMIEVSVCGEIVLKDNNFYTYRDKYIKQTSKVIIPALINENISNQIRYMSKRIFQVLNCFGMARVDLFLTTNNQIFINEVNTLPGFTDSSMYPKLWETTGICPQLLVTKLLDLALIRYC